MKVKKQLNHYRSIEKIKRKQSFKNNIFKLLLLITLLFFSSEMLNGKNYTKTNQTNSTCALKISITNIRNKTGRIQLDLYKNQSEFEARYSDKERRIYLYKKDAVNGTLSYTYKSEPAGIYGVAILDDENLNGKMDYGWVLPSEGFGFGDYWHNKWRTPTFNDFKFSLQSNKTVIVKVKYM